MYFLSINFSKCKDCGTCEKFLPGFKTIWGGLKYISKTNIDDEELRAAGSAVEAACPNGAISFESGSRFSC